MKIAEIITEHIGKVKGGYRLYSKTGGKNLGTFPSHAAAEKHEREVQYFKHKDQALEETYDGDSFYEAYGVIEETLEEAKYQGRTVQLNKPMRGDVKKFKVYVKNKKGNVIKVNFGDPNMRIKKHIPARRKSFRARHRCDTAKDKTTARYWSCRAW